MIDRSKAPARVALLGLGPSLAAYPELVKRAGGRHALYDETWCINALGDVYAHDRLFHMDDIRIQEIRAAAAPDSNIAHMVRWLKTHPGPIYTSRAHDDYPGLIEYPIDDVVGAYGYPYFNSTAAYAIAFALHLGVQSLTIYGFDYTYANAHHAEQGRACCEFWIGFACAHGMHVAIPKSSSLMDSCQTQQERLYGYDSEDVAVTIVDGKASVVRAPRATLPTAGEIEARYDHAAHPNPLMR